MFMFIKEWTRNDKVPPERDLVDTEKPKQLLFEQQKPFTDYESSGL